MYAACAGERKCLVGWVGYTEAAVRRRVLFNVDEDVISIEQVSHRSSSY